MSYQKPRIERATLVGALIVRISVIKTDSTDDAQ
jgi:hypothetical protein